MTPHNQRALVNIIVLLSIFVIIGYLVGIPLVMLLIGLLIVLAAQFA